MLRRSYQLWRSTKTRFTPTEQQRLFGLTIAIGGVCGLAAVAFHLAIHKIEALTIDNAFDVAGDGWIPWVIAVPTLGALIAGIALRYLPGARGSGIPQVKVAYATKPAKLRFRDSAGKFAIGALQLGTGSSLGREGPTVQICSGLAKGLGRLVGVSAQNLKLLLPVGSAAGIAAAFNAPIAAVTFTIEEIVGKLDQTMLSGVIVAAALAAIVERSILGVNPVFSIPQGYGLDHASSLALYVALGLAAALLSVAFTEGLLLVRKRFQAQRVVPIWARPAVGGLVTGLLAVAAMLAFHEGGITGGGYSALGQALTGGLTLKVLLVLGALKLVATVCSYSSGGAGGIFAPSLFMGAMLGGAFGALDVSLLGHGHNELGAFALVGMGAFFAGTIRAPITSVLIIIEMTGGYGLTLPLMISNMIAFGVARKLRPVPIYEALLAQDGIHLETEQAVDPVAALALTDVELAPFAAFAPGDRAAQMLDVIEGARRQEVFPVVDASSRLVGLVTLEDLTALADDEHLESLVCAADLMRAPASVRTSDRVHRALDKMIEAGVHQLPVLDDDGRIAGMLDEATIVHEYLRARVGRGAHVRSESTIRATAEATASPDAITSSGAAGTS